MRILSLLIAVTLAVALAPPGSTPATAAIETDLERVAGNDRFATAAQLAERAAGSRPARLWIATGSNYPDALAGAALGEPIVLVTRDGVPDASAAALRRIDPAQVVAVGGTAVITDATLAAAARHGQARADRVAGGDRYATSAAVAARTRTSAGVGWIATGRSFPDALAAGPIATRDGAPLLLVEGDRLHPDVERELRRLEPAEVVVVGGDRAVSPQAARAAAAAAGGAAVTRLAGPSRYDTAAAIAQRGWERHRLGDTVYLATGENFPDALAAGPAANRAAAPLLLATHRELTAPTRKMVQDLGPALVTVVGGERALSLTVAHRAKSPHARGVCDAYDATRPHLIQGHPEGLRAHLDAWSGPWTVDTFRGGWGMAVPSRWRSDKVTSFEHGGVLFYVDTEDGYSHWLRVTVFCGNPFLVAGERALDPDDPAMIAKHGPHSVLGPPDRERTSGPAIYSATWYHSPDHVRRYDYVAVADDVLLIHYDATNRFARDFDSRAARIADAIASTVSPAAQATCPSNASSCSRR
jgi:putative cell wall-binding protein